MTFFLKKVVFILVITCTIFSHDLVACEEYNGSNPVGVDCESSGADTNSNHRQVASCLTNIENLSWGSGLENHNVWIRIVHVHTLFNMTTIT